MILIPVFLNAFQFWIIDNILKFNPEQDAEGDIFCSIYENEEKHKGTDEDDDANGYNKPKGEIEIHNLDIIDARNSRRITNEMYKDGIGLSTNVNNKM